MLKLCVVMAFIALADFLEGDVTVVCCFSGLEELRLAD